MDVEKGPLDHPSVCLSLFSLPPSLLSLSPPSLTLAHSLPLVHFVVSVLWCEEERKREREKASLIHDKERELCFYHHRGSEEEARVMPEPIQEEIDKFRPENKYPDPEPDILAFMNIHQHWSLLSQYIILGVALVCSISKLLFFQKQDLLFFSFQCKK